MGIGYWPTHVDRQETTTSFLQAFGTMGFSLCFDGTFEPGTEKIALYGKGPVGTEVPTHASRQLDSGEWTSKLGWYEDIQHQSSTDVEGPVYGRVLCYLSRPRRALNG